MSGEPFSPSRGPEPDASGTGSSTSIWLSSKSKPFSCVIAGCTSHFGAEAEDDDPGRNPVPHRISCGCVVCGGCVYGMKMPDTCPVCGAKGPTVEFIDNAVAIVGKFVLTAESAPAAPRFCFDCKRLEEKDVEATHSCSCGDGKHVCGSCMLSHAHKGHKPVPLDLLASVGVDFCSKHPDEKVKVFCLDDSTATCTICAVLDHKAHNVTDLGTACSLFAPQLVGALQTLEDGCSILSNRIAAVVGERDALLATTASSEIAANASFDALHASIEAQKASGVRALYQVRDQRAVALNRQSTVLQHGLAQILDGVTVAKQALEKRNPSLMAYALKSVGVLSRIPAHAYNGPCESSVLSLDVDTTALVDALPRAFALRQASDEPEFVATTISDLMKENEGLVEQLKGARLESRDHERVISEQDAALCVMSSKLRDTEGQLVEAKQEVGVKDTTITTLRQELATAKSMEAAAIAKCSRIGTAGKGATLAPADVDALIRLGNSPVSNARIAAAFCDAVGKAGECFENPSLLGEAAIQAVISAMDTYAIDVDVQSKGCVALANLSWVEANKATLSALGALDHINRAWNVVDGDPQGQYNAVFAILFLTTSTTIAPILDAGWLERILTSMDRQVANAEYQDICCQTLHGFASEPAGKAALLAEPRSIPYLERARDNHPTHDDLQRSSRLAVEAILEPPAITECKRIGDLGHGSTLSLADVGALIRTGTNGAADAAVSAAFCYAVSSASFNGTPARDNAIHLGESAINAVLAAMDAHPADANVQSKGCRALWNITFEVDANKVLSVAAGAVARIDRAWDVIGDHNIPGILWGVEPGRFLAVGAIGSLTTAVSFQPILDAGWLNRVLAWMEDHQGSYQYQYACCQTLSAFASQPTGKAAVLADARSVPYLQRARNTHPDSPSVQRFSKSALDTIAA